MHSKSSRPASVVGNIFAIVLTLLVFLITAPNFGAPSDESNSAYWHQVFAVLVSIAFITLPLILIFLGNPIIKKAGWALLILLIIFRFVS